MQNTNTEITVFDNAQKPFYCSVKANTVEEKKKLLSQEDDFELLQLDMIIASIEAKWVDNA